MLREIKHGGFVRSHVSLLGWRWRFAQGAAPSAATWSTREVARIRAAAAGEPVALLAEGTRTIWAFEGRWYREDDGLSAQDVLALIRDRERRAARRLARAHAALAQEGAAPAPRRDPIPREVRLAVFERDGGRCVACGSAFELQFDHVIPFSMGGAATAENLQVLCAGCNRAKGASLG